jgi:hypothetical protein
VGHDLVHFFHLWIAYQVATTSPGNTNNNYRALHAWFAWLLDEAEIEVDPMARMTESRSWCGDGATPAEGRGSGACAATERAHESARR